MNDSLCTFCWQQALIEGARSMSCESNADVAREALWGLINVAALEQDKATMWENEKTFHEAVITAIKSNDSRMRHSGLSILYRLAPVDGLKEKLWSNPKISTSILTSCKKSDTSGDLKCRTEALKVLARLSDHPSVRGVMFESPGTIAMLERTSRLGIPAKDREMALLTLTNLTCDDSVKAQVWHKHAGITGVLCDASDVADCRIRALATLAILAALSENRVRMWKARGVRDEIIEAINLRSGEEWESRSNALKVLCELCNDEVNRARVWDDPRMMEGVVTDWSLEPNDADRSCLESALDVLRSVAAASKQL
jgi:hypothetical protein